MLYTAAAGERAMKVQQVLMRALSGAISWVQAAEILGLQPRSVRRWRARFEAGGSVALYDRRRQRPSRRKAPALEVQRILRLYREQFAGWNVRHFYRFARRDHAVTLSYSFVKLALQEAGLVRRAQAYITARRGAQKSNATINRELELLRRALRLAHDRQLLPSIPKVRVLTENNTRQGFFERPALEAVVTALPAYLQDFTRFAYLTGWRKGEITSLKWTDVDRDAGAIRLRPEAAKTGRGRTVMLEGDLAELVDRRWKARLVEKNGNLRVAALVFHRDGEPVGDFRKAWATACQAAGVPDKLFHDLRRTAARNMVRAGVPERVAMAVTGHLTRSMFDRYNIVSEDDLRVAAQKTTMYVDTLPTKRLPA